MYSRGGGEMNYTADQKHRAILREISWRKRVYPRRVAEGKMSAQLAHDEVMIMEEIARDYAALADKERLL
jgi:hypothetical protein